MSLTELVPKLEEILAPLLVNEHSLASFVFDGDGTTFRQNRDGNAWDINPARGIISTLTKIAAKGHLVLLTSAREVEDIRASPFKVIPGISFHGNDGQDGDGLPWQGGVKPNFNKVQARMTEKFGDDAEIRPHVMSLAYGMQFWADTHPDSTQIKTALQEAIPLIDDPLNRQFKLVSPVEGHYLVLVDTPGKDKAYGGYVEAREKAGKIIKLHVGGGNGGNDRNLITGIGDRDNGIAFWVGPQRPQPEGENVFPVDDEDTLAMFLEQLEPRLPDRSG